MRKELASNYIKLGGIKKYLDGHNGFIAGGCFKNIFNGDKPKDIDIFFEKKDDFDEARAYFECEKRYPIKYETDNVVAFYDKKQGLTIELVCKHFGTPEEILSDFDFTIVKFVMYTHTSESVLDSEEDKREVKVMYHNQFFEHLFLKRLIIDDDIILPINTFERALKYQRYGYGMCKESKVLLLTAIMDWSANNSSSPSELEEALTNELYNGID